MSRADIIGITRDLIYGHGLGEKPSVRRAASAATVTPSGGTVSFDLLAGEGAKVRAGDVLALRGTTAVSNAAVLEVLSVATDTVTAVVSDGSITPANLNDAILDQNPLVTELTMHRALTNIVANWLYPTVFEIDATVTATPNLSTLQVELPATTREILSAHQVVSGIVYPVGARLVRHLATALSSTGVLAEIDCVDGSTIYFTTITEITDAATDEGIQYMIASGAAALSLDGTVAETQLESAKSDAQNRDTGTAAQQLWRAFLSQRASLAEDLSRDTLRLEIYR